MLGRRRGGAEGRLPNSRRERGIEDEDENEDDYDCCSFEVDGQLVAVGGFGAGGVGAQRSTVRLTVVFRVAVWQGLVNGDQDGLSRTGKSEPTTVPEVPLVR